jgi:hypothetical protein
MSLYNARTRTPPRGTSNLPPAARQITSNLPPAARQGGTRVGTNIITPQRGDSVTLSSGSNLFRGVRGGVSISGPPHRPPHTRALQGAIKMLEQEVGK